jgi:hypothetical protein
MGSKNTGVLFAVFVIVLGMWGCSQEGNLVVKNECSTEFQGEVANQPVMIDSNMEYRTNVYIGKTLGVVGPKDIEVVISGGAWTKKNFTEAVQIRSGETTTYRIVNDVGACAFTNDYTLSINALSVKPCESGEFQPNLLAKNEKLSPGEDKLLQLDKGCWDILVNYGREEFLDTVTAVEIRIGEVDTVKWRPGFGNPVPPPPGAGL